MAILEPVPAQPDQVGNVTITINSKGEINVDQSALATILGSGQQSARVTFVRVGEEGTTIENQVDLDASELLAAVGGQVDSGLGQEEGGVVGASPMLLLDQDQMMKLESVLQSDEARNILGDTCDGGGEEENEEGKVAGGQGGPTRRSQRQVDRETRQTADKIRAENQELMRKEEPVKVTREDEGSVVPVITARGKGRGRGGMMRGGTRPRRQTRVPRHLADQEMPSLGRKESQSGAESDSSETGSWASEDDPDRLWCVCQQPHNNRFMICCDICLDWFHGKCVGITKAQGKVMEEAGQDWKCPPCLAGLAENTTTTTTVTASTEEGTEEAVNMEELIEDKEETNDDFEDDDFKDEIMSPPSSSSNTPKKVSQAPVQTQARTRGRRKSSSGGQQEVDGVKVKEKVVTCHMCSNKPRESSIYCSEECIKAHANQALSLLTQDGKTTKANNPVVVLEPKTNTLLNGPNAPTEGSLQTWLQAHTSFHVVMPSKPSSSKFYGAGAHNSSKNRTGPKLIAPHRETPEKKPPGPAHRISFMEALQRKPVKSKEEMVAETKATLRR